MLRFLNQVSVVHTVLLCSYLCRRFIAHSFLASNRCFRNREMVVFSVICYLLMIRVISIISAARVIFRGGVIILFLDKSDIYSGLKYIYIY